MAIYPPMNLPHPHNIFSSFAPAIGVLRLNAEKKIYNIHAVAILWLNVIGLHFLEESGIFTNSGMGRSLNRWGFNNFPHKNLVFLLRPTHFSLRPTYFSDLGEALC